MFVEHLQPTQLAWKHDRSLTVGASEIGACAKQTWYRKRGQPEERELPWGWGERGHNVERWGYEALKRAGFRVYRKQHTMARNHLSATIDGRVNNIITDLKSFDPWKKHVVEEKHIWQVVCQIGLYNDTYKRQMDRGVLIYINASNYQDMREHVVEPDPAAYHAAHIRANYIIHTTTPPAREGVLAGGKECQWCPFQTACLGTALPTGLGKLSEAETAGIAEAREVVIAAEAEIAAHERRVALAKEAIREILRSADARRAPGLARISRGQRMNLDQKAVEKAGIDLSPFRKPGQETETVVVE